MTDKITRRIKELEDAAIEFAARLSAVLEELRDAAKPRSLLTEWARTAAAQPTPPSGAVIAQPTPSGERLRKTRKSTGLHVRVLESMRRAGERVTHDKAILAHHFGVTESAMGIALATLERAGAVRFEGGRWRITETGLTVRTTRCKVATGTSNRLPIDRGYVQSGALRVLERGPATAKIISAEIGERVKVVSMALKKMADSGSVEVCGRTNDGAYVVSLYRRVGAPKNE